MRSVLLPFLFSLSGLFLFTLFSKNYLVFEVHTFVVNSFC
jgi:hypothetical protein